jgi:hypothetical protein
MKLLLFKTVAEAEVARAKLDAAAGLPREHNEGSGPGDYVINSPGEAAEAIRDAGVRTEHVCDLVVSPDERVIGLLLPDDPRSVEVDVSNWPAPTMERS